MGQEGRSDETQWKQKQNRRQRRPMLERRRAKEVQDGHVGEIMAEEENRKGDENEKGNKNNASLHNR